MPLRYFCEMFCSCSRKSLVRFIKVQRFCCILLSVNLIASFVEESVGQDLKPQRHVCLNIPAQVTVISPRKATDPCLEESLAAYRCLIILTTSIAHFECSNYTMRRGTGLIENPMILVRVNPPTVPRVGGLLL